MTHAFIGLMVQYRLTFDQARIVNWTPEGEIVPMVITRVLSDGTVDGQLFIAQTSLWVVAVAEGDLPGQWQAITNG